MTLLAVCLAAITAWNHQLTADLCRLCLGAGNPLGKDRSRAGVLQCMRAAIVKADKASVLDLWICIC